MVIREGHKFQHRLNRGIYRVVLTVEPDTVVLQSKGSSYRMWFSEEGLELFFDRIGSFRVLEGGEPQR
jgi:hypothetical protein